MIYGPGGSGKTELASLLSKMGVKPLIVDVENGSLFLDVDRVKDIATFEELRSVLHDTALLDQFGAVVVDSFTKTEELVREWVIENVKHEKGHAVERIEDYGFGKGFTHIYEAFLLILGDLDSLARRGKHVIGICHDCVDDAPNPGGDDWKRYEPRLQNPGKGKASIRSRTKEWCDHLFYIGYDVMTNKDGKGIGSGTRTIYTTEMPTHWAKSRDLSEPIPYTKGSAELWNQLFNR